MSYRNTHNGKTALQILERAEVSQMRAGTWEITTRDFPECIIVADEDFDLVVSHAGGIAARVICCAEAKDKLQALTEQTENKMLAASPHFGA